MPPDQLQNIRRCKRLIEFFNAIPEEKWCQHRLGRQLDPVGLHWQACALGHLGIKSPDALWMQQKFHECFAGTPLEKRLGRVSVEAVNDYPGNPKRQILLVLSEVLKRLTAPRPTASATLPDRPAGPA